MLNATFSMVGKNPPAIFIVGGILFLLIGGITVNSTVINSSFFVGTGIILLVLGILLQLVWLWLKNR